MNGEHKTAEKTSTVRMSASCSHQSYERFVNEIASTSSGKQDSGAQLVVSFLLMFVLDVDRMVV